jgi:2-dehydropantoate 2-reductase
MNDKRGEIAVVGAGSIGCYLGGLLSAHAEVCLIGRERVREIIDTHGMLLTDLEGGRMRLEPGRARFVTDMQAASTAALVLVTVKSDDTPTVARELAPVLRDDAVVVSFQNGLRNVPVLREALPGRTVLAGMVPYNVLHLGHGRLHRASEGTLMIARDDALEPFVDAFAQAGLALELRDDMPAVQWAKLLFNLNNAINALSDLPLRDELALRPYRRCLALAQREALRAMRAAGIRPARLTPLPARWGPRMLELPDALFQRLAQRMLAVDPLARSSTWEDLAAGRRTEVEHINGEVVRLAQAHGLKAPVNARLVELVHAAEKGQRSIWGRTQLWDELREAAKSE